MVGVGELIGVAGGCADEVAVDADGLFLGVEIDDGNPKLAVRGAGVGAAGGLDVEVGNWIAIGIDEAAGGGMGLLDVPVAAQRGWRAERDLLMMPSDDHVDGLDDEERDSESDLGDEDSDAPGAASGVWNPGGGRRGGIVAPEEVVESERVGQSEEDAAEEQIGGEELDGDVEEKVVEDDIGHDESGKNGSGECGAAVEQQDATEDFGRAADHLVDRVEPDHVPKQSHGRQVAHGLIEHSDGRRRHLEREDLGQAITNHEHAAGEAEKETKPGV